MKRLTKIVGSAILVGSMLLGMTGCTITDVKNTGDEIMEQALNSKSKITKHFDEDDDDYDAQVDFMDELFELMDELSIELDETEYKSKSVSVNNGDATVVYQLSYEDYEAELELNLTKDGDDWIIADNEEFIVAFSDFVFQAAYEEGKKADKEEIEDGMDYLGVSKVGKLAQATYDMYIDENS